MWPSKSLEQKIPIRQNGVKNPNWGEENQLDIYKGGWGFKLGTAENKSS